MRPLTPGTEGTTAASREAIRPHAATMRDEIYAAIKRAGAAGLSDAEIEAITRFPGSTVRPRRIELWRAGHIRELNGTKRRTPAGRVCAVWIVARPGELF